MSAQRGVTTTTRPCFPLGQIVATPGALTVLEQAGVTPWSLLGRHQHGDWGEVDAEDWQTNDWSVRNGERIVSAYTVGGERIWILTERDRSSTCLLRPSEY